MNKIILTGRIATPLELKQTATGKKVSTFRLAVPRTYGKGELDTDFFNVTAWAATAEFITKYFTKGSRIELIGHVAVGTYTDKEGIRHTTFDVVAEEIMFGESKKEADARAERSAQPAQFAASAPPDNENIGITDDELPF